ncbi:glutamine synthetase [Mesorhizobium sp. B2-5-13]|uniref:glutamine synthetase family protein n=1 Tax=unclassified Mesorhizobium TaxID=325217 RepID=UPI00112DCE02|nr:MULTISPECIES: glutamine synthetase family protein [unclassified Mesorhizobium]TPJ81936.1 glutamine synthetase [Mesorhizobium sp. B2-5-13]TPK45873.1 glutamine synthetase [Mesorhizobium sp. B2-5-5]
MTIEHLVTIATTDLTAITRGRPVPASQLEKSVGSGVGWVPANLSLTPFGGIVADNPWGSAGDLRLIPDLDARYHTALTGSATPFDIVLGNLVELDGAPWIGCTRSLLKAALTDFTAATGHSIIGTFEQEFQLLDGALAPAHPFSISALRRTDPFPTTLFAALSEAGAAPEMVLAEFGADQFEITNAPVDALVAADRAVVIREITRELARNSGWRASFTPKPAPTAVGNGVHIHFSFADGSGNPATYDPAGPGGLSPIAAAFCAGVVRHLPAITCLTASAVPSYYRLKPHSWSSSYTWLAQQDREASLRICPTVTMGNRDPSKQYNIEYRVADATSNPYLAMTAIVRAGLDGIRTEMATPPLFSGDPEKLTVEERGTLGLRRLPQSLQEAIDELKASETVTSWFAPQLVQSFVGVKLAEIEHCASLEPDKVCNLYGGLY